MMANFLGNNLKYLRKKKNVNQSEVALIVHRGATTIGNWENYISTPNIEELEILSKYFEILAHDLLYTDIAKTHLNDFEKGGKKQQNTHLNTHPNTHLKGKYNTGEPSRFTTAHEPEPTYTQEQAKDELIRTQKFTIDMLKEALAAAQQRLEEAKKAKK